MKTTASKIKHIFTGLLILLVMNNGIAQYSVTTNKKHQNVTISKNGITSFKVEHKGTIEISDDDTDVIAISPGGFLEISKAVFGNRRTVRIESANGGLKKEYYVGRQRVDFDPEGKAWLAEILPEVVRSTSIGAKSRVDRIYKNDGVSGVMEELDYIESDYVISIYTSILLEKPSLSNKELVEILDEISNKMDSDYYLSNVLKDNSKKLLQSDETTTAYLGVISEIGSDYYASMVLKEALDKGTFSTKQAEAIVDAAKNIGSDYYMSSVFQEVMENEEINDEIIISVLSASENIHSDHYLTEVLKDVVDRDNLSAEIHSAVLEVVGNISSDHYMSEVFKEMLDNDLNEEEVVEMIEIVNENMSSDHYTSVVIRELVDVQQMTNETVTVLVELVENLSSSHYATEILKEISNENLTERQLITLLDATSSISSDHYLTTVLIEFSDEVRNGSDELKEAYRKAAKSINSDTYYGKAIKAIE